MDWSLVIDWTRVAIASVVLVYAAALDLRTRRVGNAPWLLMAVLGIALLPAGARFDDQPYEFSLVIIPIAAVLSDIYMNSREGSFWDKYGPAVKYSIAITSVIVLASFWMEESYFQALLAVPVMMMVIVLMYMLDLIRGGADAKALVSLTVLFPFYPDLGGLPLSEEGIGDAAILFPFSFTVLVIAAMVVALAPLWFAVKNVSRREFKFPIGFFGYKLDHDKVATSHVWLMERIEDGRHRVNLRPRHDEDLAKEVELLVKNGHDRIWITPKVPFIVPIALGFFLTVAFGNILYSLFSF